MWSHLCQNHPNLLAGFLMKKTRRGSSSLGFRIGSADKPQSSDVNIMVNGETSVTSPVNKAEAVPISGKSLTLEALFGAVFMNQLHSTKHRARLADSLMHPQTLPL